MIYIALFQLLGKEVEQKVVIRACLRIISHFKFDHVYVSLQCLSTMLVVKQWKGVL